MLHDIASVRKLIYSIYLHCVLQAITGDSILLKFERAKGSLIESLRRVEDIVEQSMACQVVFSSIFPLNSCNQFEDSKSTNFAWFIHTQESRLTYQVCTLASCLGFSVGFSANSGYKTNPYSLAIFCKHSLSYM